MNILTTIALLCHVAIGNGYSDINYEKHELMQNKCQIFYLKCFESGKIGPVITNNPLAKCVELRNIALKKRINK